MAEISFEELREGHLLNADKKGKNLMEESLKEIAKNDKLEHLATILPAQFAAETADYSVYVKEDLQENTGDYVQKQAAEFVGYEAREKARKSGLQSIDVALGDENKIDLSKFGINAKVQGWESWLSDFYREFSQIDYLQRGLSEHKMENRSPEKIHEETIQTDNWLVKEDDAGELYMDSIYVVDEDWVDFRRGKKPAAYDEKVVEYLNELGVGNYRE